MPAQPLRPATPPAPATEAAAALDLIFIEGYLGHTVIGIHPSEFDGTQPLLIDLHAGLPRAAACDSDRIADTIDYSVVRERLDALMRDHGVSLLEALAERIARMLLLDFGAAWVRVRVRKPHKFDNVQSVGVQIERHRQDLRPAALHEPAPQPAPEALPTKGAAVLRWIGAGLVPQPAPQAAGDTRQD